MSARRPPLEYGWLVSTDTSAKEQTDVPSDLWTLAQRANRSGCAWIRFDRDAPLIPGLDCFDW